MATTRGGCLASEATHARIPTGRPRCRTARRQQARASGTGRSPGTGDTFPLRATPAAPGPDRVRRRGGRTPTNRLLGNDRASANPRYRHWVRVAAAAVALKTPPYAPIWG